MFNWKKNVYLFIEVPVFVHLGILGKLERSIHSEAYNVLLRSIRLSTFVLSIYIERKSKRAKQTID